MSNSNETILPPLALLHDGDSFFLHLIRLGPKSLVLQTIVRHSHNESNVGEVWNFRDLNPEEKRAVISHILRRYEGNTVKV